uniref:Transcription factor LIM n=1 Tax=Solanum tuberosum TaxID=4113 RepID=M1ATW0_SOLTU
MAFAGTTQKCMACEKTVYLVDKLTADNRVFHKACFRCYHCKGTLKLSNYNSFEGVLYCRPHFDQLFKRTGSLDKSFEGTPKIVKPEKDEVIDIYIARTLQICCITRVRSSKITLLLEDLTRAPIDIFEESEQTYIDL